MKQQRLVELKPSHTSDVRICPSQLKALYLDLAVMTVYHLLIVTFLQTERQ